MRAYDYNDHREFIKAKIASMPNRGRGELLRLAAHTGLYSSSLSQIMSGKKQFTLEQGCLVADYLGLNEKETEYFILLINHDRAGTPLLKKSFANQIQKIQKKSQDLAHRLPQDHALTEEQKSMFYSNWFYTAIWAQSAIPGYQTREALNAHFPLSRKLVNQVVDFLIKTGLCVEENGKIGPSLTYAHLESTSPLIARHHGNWRLKAMERHSQLQSETEIAYSCPMTLSQADAIQMRKKVVAWIEEINQVRRDSTSEALFCANIDWFRVV